MNQMNDDRNNIFHERVNILVDEGYSGFTVDKISGNNDTREFNVEATNHKGVKLTAKGETKEEACKKLIDLIDITLDKQ